MKYLYFFSKAESNAKELEEDILSYVTLLNELYEPDPQAYDVMSVCGSILLLSEIPLEEKIDILFSWMRMDDSHDHNTSEESLSFDDFYLSLVSLEKGLAHAIGRKASNSEYIFKIAQQWFLPTKQSRSKVEPTLSKSKFFDLCSDRHHVIRQLLTMIADATSGDSIDHEEHATVPESSLIRDPPAADEWLANPPWKKTAEKMTPPNYVANKSKPNSILELEWVHGYRGYDCRNNVFYCTQPDGRGEAIVYHAAALGIILTPASNSKDSKQDYFGEHTDDIISIAVFQPESSSPDGTLIATGEIGKKPAIHLWRPGALHSIACMSGFHTKGVCQLAFSRDGSTLFSIGVEYSVALYCVKEGKGFGRLLGSAQGPKDKVLHCSFCGSDGLEFVSCGEKHVTFWKLNGNVPKPEQAKLGTDKNKMFLCIATLASGDVVVGTNDGDIFRINGAGGALVKPSGSTGKHEGAVNAIYSPPSSKSGGIFDFITAGKDGRFKLWTWRDAGLVMVGNISVLDPQPPNTAPVSLRAVCWTPGDSHSLGRVILGTQNCCILEYSLSGTATAVTGELLHRGALISGHFKDELWGLAVCPLNAAQVDQEGPQYCTVGDDGYLRVWGVRSHRQLRAVSMGGMARACAYHPSGEIIAVGFGGRVGRGSQKMDGIFRIYRATGDMAAIFEGQDTKKWISEVKFSPDGSILAIGSHDDSIYLYSYTNQFQKKAKFSKHNSFITHFDFSSDSKYLQSNCGAYELLFSNTTNGSQVMSGSQLKDVIWATWTCPLGWPVQGIWPSGADGSDINSVDRSPSGQVIATADDFGKVKLFRFPCVAPDSLYSQYNGHSSHVTNVRWMGSTNGCGEYLISTGGDDKCTFQWKHITGEDDGNATGSRKGSAYADELSGSAHQDSDAVIADALDVAPAGGDEFMAVKPWLGAIVAPSAWAHPNPGDAVQFFAALGEFSAKHNLLHRAKPYPSEELYETVRGLAEGVLEKLSSSGYVNKTAPDVDELSLDWVHGYKGFDSRNNVRYVMGTKNRTNEVSKFIAYPAAGLGVVYDPVTKTQRYFRGHTDDVLCLAVCQRTAEEGGAVVATGQQGPCKTYVWSVSDLTPLATLTTGQKSVVMLTFSTADGHLLVTIGEDNSVAVSDWKGQRIIASVKGEPAPTYHLVYSSTPNSFLSCGDKHIRIWSLAGRNLTSTKVATSATVGKKKGCPQAFLCATQFGEFWVVGCEDGSLYKLAVSE